MDTTAIVMKSYYWSYSCIYLWSDLILLILNNLFDVRLPQNVLEPILYSLIRQMSHLSITAQIRESKNGDMGLVSHKKSVRTIVIFWYIQKQFQVHTQEMPHWLNPSEMRLQPLCILLSAYEVYEHCTTACKHIIVCPLVARYMPFHQFA